MRTLFYKNRPQLIGFAGVGGKAEGESPAASDFDITVTDDMWGEKSFELAERKMFLTAVYKALSNASLSQKDITLLLGGDLLNQIISASFAARELSCAFLGLYGACSTMAESLLLAGALVNAGYVGQVAAATSSHFATAERQFRMPLELGTPKTPTAQLTATAAGCAIVREHKAEDRPALTCATMGRVIDYGITDASNMGAAMMPAALETLVTHLEETKRPESYYDLIVTGDLGTFGASLMQEEGRRHGLTFKNYTDCGAELYKGRPEIYCGASGCGCSALMLCGYYLKRMMAGEIGKLLFIATGALMSPTSTLQGESIPAVAHAVAIERGV